MAGNGTILLCGISPKLCLVNSFVKVLTLRYYTVAKAGQFYQSLESYSQQRVGPWAKKKRCENIWGFQCFFKCSPLIQLYKHCCKSKKSSPGSKKCFLIGSEKCFAPRRRSQFRKHCFFICPQKKQCLVPRVSLYTKHCIHSSAQLDNKSHKIFPRFPWALRNRPKLVGRRKCEKGPYQSVHNVFLFNFFLISELYGKLWKLFSNYW